MENNTIYQDLLSFCKNMNEKKEENQKQAEIIYNETKKGLKEFLSKLFDGQYFCLEDGRSIVYIKKVVKTTLADNFTVRIEYTGELLRSNVNNDYFGFAGVSVYTYYKYTKGYEDSFCIKLKDIKTLERITPAEFKQLKNKSIQIRKDFRDVYDNKICRYDPVCFVGDNGNVEKGCVTNFNAEKRVFVVVDSNNVRKELPGNKLIKVRTA